MPGCPSPRLHSHGDWNHLFLLPHRLAATGARESADAEKAPQGKWQLLGPVAQRLHSSPAVHCLRIAWLSLLGPAVPPTFPLGRSPPRLTSAHPTLGSMAAPPPRPLAQLVLVTWPRMFTAGLTPPFSPPAVQILKGAPLDPSCWASGGPLPWMPPQCGEQVSG